LAGLAMVALALTGWGLALAQDGGLGDEQRALLDRVFEARARLDTYASYVEENAGSEVQALTIVLGGQALEFNDATEWEQTQTILNTEEGQNVTAQIRATVKGEDWPDYVVMAEARLVDGTLYVRAAYEDAGKDLLPPLPEGWIVVDDPDAPPEAYPALEALQLDSLGRDPSNLLLEDQDLFRAVATDVRSEPVALDDGTQAEQISVIINRDGLVTVLAESAEDPFQQALYSALSDASQATLVLLLDAAGEPLQVRTEFFMAVEEMDATALNPDDFPEGTTLAFTFAGREEMRYSQVNEPFKAVTAPEEAVAKPAG